MGLCTRNAGTDLALGVPVAVAAFATWLLGLLMLYLTWPSGLEEMRGNVDAIQQMLPPIHPVLLVTLQFIVAAYEELVFRGFLLTRLRRALGSWWAAAVLCSVIFTIPHALDQKLPAVVPLFLLGCLLCGLTIWRKSILPAVVGHALFNSANLLVIYFGDPQWR